MPRKNNSYLYADDTEISSSSDNFDTLIENLNYDLNNIRKWLSKNKLKHHPTKSKVCGKVSAGIGTMRRIKPFVPPVTLQTIYKTLVQPYFDYCWPWLDNCGKVIQDKLQKFQNRAARIITGASYDVRSADVLDTLGWETLDARRSRNKSVLM